MKRNKQLFKIPYRRKEQMAKRYTDSEKWKKDFIKTLPAEYKLFWLYLLDECDNAGIWHVELDIAEMRLGFKLSVQKIRGLFGEKVVEFDNGSKWFLPDFISFQYGQLDIKNKAHKSVADKLNKYKLLESKGHTRVLEDPKDKDKELVKDKEGVGKNLPGKPFPDNVPEPTKDFIGAISESIYRVKLNHVTPEQILEYWKSWKVLYLTGDNFYTSANDVHKHFGNVCKGQNWKTISTDVKPTKHKTAAELIAEREAKANHR